MEFLVRTELVGTGAADLPPEVWSRERDRGRHLRAEGVLRHLWRLPGCQGNIAVYEVVDADELHLVLTSLPLWPYTTTVVEALATHPLMEISER